jgi:hypothetical protein
MNAGEEGECGRVGDGGRMVAGLIPDEYIAFSIHLLLPAALALGVGSASKRNEYQECSVA